MNDYYFRRSALQEHTRTDTHSGYLEPISHLSSQTEEVKLETFSEPNEYYQDGETSTFHTRSEQAD